MCGYSAPMLKREPRWILGTALAFATLAGCGDKASSKKSRDRDDDDIRESEPKKNKASAEPSAKSTGVTIKMGPDGQTIVEGAGTMKGDEKTCAAMKACCAAPNAGLFCGLAQATDGADCASVLKGIQAHMAEAKIAKPAGCP
jgi:hypothetical protein